VGQFANRDFWVVGPVKIIGINPPSTLISGRIKNGSMVNPAPGNGSQGYDNSMPYNTYNAALNVAADRSAGNPLVLAAARPGDASGPSFLPAWSSMIPP
jgi:hypothetical protein